MLANFAKLNGIQILPRKEPSLGCPEPDALHVVTIIVPEVAGRCQRRRLDVFNGKKIRSRDRQYACLSDFRSGLDRPALDWTSSLETMDRTLNLEMGVAGP